MSSTLMNTSSYLTLKASERCVGTRGGVLGRMAAESWDRRFKFRCVHLMFVACRGMTWQTSDYTWGNNKAF
jgi:hypothetical protein